jgi:hypothetical protein
VDRGGHGAAMKIIVINVALVIVGSMVLGGCFEPGIQQGWIYGKHFYPAWVSWTSTKTCGGDEEESEMSNFLVIH